MSVQELLLEHNKLNMSSCGGMVGFCEAWRLPPPDIFNIPPPPLPPFLADLESQLTVKGVLGVPERGEEFCDLCQWATGYDIGFVQLSEKGDKR